MGCKFRIHPIDNLRGPVHNHDLLQVDCSLVHRAHTLDKDKVVDDGEVIRG